MIEHRPSEMGATDGAAAPVGELHHPPEVAHGVRHPRHARRAIEAEARQRVAQRRGAMVDAVAEDVEVLPVAVERRELRPRDESEVLSVRRLERLVDAVHRVMVGQRQ
jgi:hypothetical protein